VWRVPVELTRLEADPKGGVCRSDNILLLRATSGRLPKLLETTAPDETRASSPLAGALPLSPETGPG
jgi:hypothetical protein